MSNDRDTLTEVLHEHIDGDYLLGGGGWGPDGWVDDIPHTQARISDLVRWVTSALAPWLAAHDRAVEQRALRDAADQTGDVIPHEIRRWLRDRADALGQEQPRDARQ